MCLKIHELYPEKFISALGLTWQAALKNTKVKLHLLTAINGRKKHKRWNMLLYL